MGRVARATSHTTRNGARKLSRAWFLILAAGFFCFCLVAPAWSQSGRKQEPGKGKPVRGPIADKPGNSGSTNQPTKATDEVDQDDIVRISSNLVPIPVSVVDKRGTAVVNLKLDDFELRVDGEIRPLSDLTRS